MGVRSEQCSCSQDTCRLVKTHNMNAKLLLVLAIGGQCVLGRRQLRGMEEGRDPRSLVNSFPFNANDQGHHDHHDHHGDHGDHAARNPVQNLAARDNRQAQATVKENPTSFDDVAAVSPGTDGKRCIDKVEMIEECVDVPKEVCTRSRTNPRPVKKPVVKKWCYVPSEESGLA